MYSWKIRVRKEWSTSLEFYEVINLHKEQVDFNKYKKNPSKSLETIFWDNRTS